MSQAQLPSKSTSPRYDASFKRHAVEQVLVHLRPVAQVARQLQCSPQSVANWVKQHQNSVPPTHSPKSHPSLCHPAGQASSCQHTKPLSHCSQSANASLCHSSESSLSPPMHFLPLEVVDVGTAPLHSSVKTGLVYAARGKSISTSFLLSADERSRYSGQTTLSQMFDRKKLNR